MDYVEYFPIIVNIVATYQDFFGMIFEINIYTISSLIVDLLRTETSLVE